MLVVKSEITENCSRTAKYEAKQRVEQAIDQSGEY
jgi:hypothetical protein